VHRPVVVVRLSILSAGLVYSLLLYLSGVELNSWTKRILTLLPAFGAGFLALWDVWLWRLPGVKNLVRRPRLDGLWQVTLTPTDDSHIPQGGNRGPIAAFLIISQSYWSIHVRQYTAESISRSRAFFWEQPNGADTERLTFIYDNDPKQSQRHRSTWHLGSCILDPANRRPLTMSGVYFTDRYTKGDMEILLIDRTKGYGSFGEAERHTTSICSSSAPSIQIRDEDNHGRQ